MSSLKFGSVDQKLKVKRLRIAVANKIKLTHKYFTFQQLKYIPF